MASIQLHRFIERIRGKFGDIVVRTLKGRSFIARPPDLSKVGPPSPGQIAVRQRFQFAAAYGRGVMADPTAQAFYAATAESQQRSIAAVAAADYFSVPEVSLINADRYQGKIGDRIVLLIGHTGPVEAVDVTLRTADHAVVEEGRAAIVDGLWTYTATTALAAGQAVTIEVLAKDRPGNIGTGTLDYTQP